jgi:hypothetical protein
VRLLYGTRAPRGIADPARNIAQQRLPNKLQALARRSPYQTVITGRSTGMQNRCRQRTSANGTEPHSSLLSPVTAAQ